MSVSWGGRSQPTTIVYAVLVFACACVVAMLAGPAALPGASAPETSHGHLKLPLSFVPNRGQLDSGQVRYYAPGPASSIYLTKSMAAISMTGGADHGAALHLRFLGANPDVTLLARDPRPGRVNYISTSERHTGLPTYAGVTYRDLWPGIDMTFHTTGARLKYEFVVHPGADPAAIRLAYAGGAAPVITQAGELRVATAAGPLTDARPHSYQRAGGRRVPVRSRFVLRGGNSHGFALARYDTGRPLVIDPELAYSTFLGGGSSDEPYGIDTDSQGHAYVVGYTNSSDFPTTPGAFQETPNGLGAFVTKLNQDGTGIEYSTFIDGSQYEEARGVAVDAQGNAYVAGFTVSPDFPTTAGAFDTSHNGSYDGFLAKLNAAGSDLLYSTYLGGSSYEGPTAVALGGDNSAYLTGNTASSDFPTTPGAFQTTNQGGNDVFVARVSPSGSNLVYSTLLGSSGFSEFAYSVAVDGAGNAYTTGRTDSEGFPTTPGAFARHYSGSDDAFVSKISPNGTDLLASTYLGTPGTESGSGVATDSLNQPYVTGGFQGYPAFATTPGAYSTTPAATDGFLTKFDPTLSTLTYSTLIGGGFPGGTFGGHSLEVDARGNAHVTGMDGGDVFVKRFDPTGSQLTYSATLAGNARETSAGIALDDGARNAYVAGATDSTDFPTTPGAYDTQHDGASDGFVAKLPLLPQSTAGCRVSGAGKIVAANGDAASFNGTVRASSNAVTGQVRYDDRGRQERLTLRSRTIDALVCQANGATITGVAKIKGKDVDFTIEQVDGGNPGRRDTYRLQLSSGYDSGTQTLVAGNLQVRSH